MSNGDDQKEFVSNFAYPKCMITCSMKKKRRGKEDREEKKKALPFFVIAK